MDKKNSYLFTFEENIQKTINLEGWSLHINRGSKLIPINIDRGSNLASIKNEISKISESLAILAEKLGLKSDDKLNIEFKGIDQNGQNDPEKKTSKTFKKLDYSEESVNELKNKINQYQPPKNIIENKINTYRILLIGDSDSQLNTFSESLCCVMKEVCKYNNNSLEYNKNSNKINILFNNFKVIITNIMGYQNFDTKSLDQILNLNTSEINNEIHFVIFLYDILDVSSAEKSKIIQEKLNKLFDYSKFTYWLLIYLILLRI